MALSAPFFCAIPHSRSPLGLCFKKTFSSAQLATSLLPFIRSECLPITSFAFQRACVPVAVSAVLGPTENSAQQPRSVALSFALILLPLFYPPPPPLSSFYLVAVARRRIVAGARARFFQTRQTHPPPLPLHTRATHAHCFISAPAACPSPRAPKSGRRTSPYARVGYPPGHGTARGPFGEVFGF